MNPTCIQAVRDAARAMGKERITAGQIEEIDRRMSRTMRELARTEPNWQALSADQRLAAGAERAMQDIAAEAQRKVVNAQMQIVKTAAVEQRIAEALAQFKGEARAQALVRDMERTAIYAKGVHGEAFGGLLQLMDAVQSGKGAGAGRRVSMFLLDADNPQMRVDLMREVYAGADGSTGNKVAQEGAKAWLKVIEDLRQSFNAAGGDIGQLDYGYVPQPHDAARVRKVGADAWAQQTLALVDRARYVDEAGARLGDAEVLDILRGIHKTIATEGLNKMEPGQFKGSGARANRGSEHRELHFKGADAYLEYMAAYGRGSLYDAMSGHVGRVARDIALVERYGPNPAAQMRLQFDLAAKADGTPVDNLKRTFGMRPESYWSQLNGDANAVASHTLAKMAQHARNVQVFGKLGGAVVSSITDLGTYVVTTGYNRLPYWTAVANAAKVATSKSTRDWLTTHGMIAESMAGDLRAFVGENIAHDWSGRLANSTMKLSLMNKWTDALRRGFALTMMQGMARLSKVEWAKLGEWDRAHLERAGIHEADWAVITKAELTEFGGVQHLTPEAIRAGGGSDELVSKVLGMIQNESEYASIAPDLAARTAGTLGGTQAGTMRGELARSVMQFKSFPLAMISRHWRRMLDAPTVTDGSAPILANRVAYAAALMVSTTALGAIAYQGKQIAAGKDPVDMTGPHAGKFWARAVAQGGGLSIVGDMLLNDPGNSVSDFVRSFTGSLAGPTLSTAAEGLGIAVENVHRAAKGKETHAAAETLKLARSNAPLVNLWYAKAAIDHAGMHALQENLSPGYLGRMKQRSAQEWGQGYWWAPGSGGPERAPDVGKAVGQ